MVSYQPMPAAWVRGLGLTNLPRATFFWDDSDGAGCFCVDGVVRRRVPIRIPVRCRVVIRRVASAPPRRSCPGYFPDQVWVDGRALTQVMDKSLVKQGTFFVPAAPPRMLLRRCRVCICPEDAVDMSKVRVSSSTGNFWGGPGRQCAHRGVRIVNHSPTWAQYSVVATEGVDDFVMKDVELDSNASIAVKLAGGSAAGGGQLMRRAPLQRVKVRRGRAGPVGIAVYRRHGGARLGVRPFQCGCGVHGDPAGWRDQSDKERPDADHQCPRQQQRWSGVWWDQSNYDVVLADSEVSGTPTPGVLRDLPRSDDGHTLIANNTGGPDCRRVDRRDRSWSTTRLSAAGM